MRNLLRFIVVIFMCTHIVYADTETLQWYVDDNVYATTTCESGADIILPNTPTKYGYTFQGWLVHTPVEYLESTGTQYIDTDYKVNINSRFIVTFSNISAWIGGGPVTLAGRMDDFGIAQKYIRFGTSYYVYTFTTQKYTVLVDHDGFKINGVQTNWTSAPSITNNNQSVYLFWASGSGAAKSGRIYSAQIYDNDILVRDFIPVIDPNGIPCMYDKVESKFYYNAGTGDFIAGPVISD